MRQRVCIRFVAINRAAGAERAGQKLKAAEGGLLSMIIIVQSKERSRVPPYVLKNRLAYQVKEKKTVCSTFYCPRRTGPQSI